MPISQSERTLFFTAESLGENELVIKRIRASEGMSQLFRFELELLYDMGETEGFEPHLIPINRVLGKWMAVNVEQPDGAKRVFHGICVDFIQGNRDERYTRYTATVVPEPWFLTQTSHNRIFQNLRIPDILGKVFDGYNVSIRVNQGLYQPRNYCVQYNESDWDFASRLMEDEGIFYFFEHSSNGHTLVITDADSNIVACPSKEDIPFEIDVASDQNEWQGAVRSWQVVNRSRTGKFMLRDHHFQLPTNPLEAEEPTHYEVNGNSAYEVYEFPGGYAKHFDGVDASGGDTSDQLQKVFTDRQRFVEIRQQEIDSMHKSAEGRTDCCAMIPGFRFKLTTHPTAANNTNHTIVTLQTEAVQSPGYHSDEDVRNAYVSSFTTIPQGEGQARFRPLRKTRRPVMNGCQTATVVGASGEEIYTDKFGRVKVQFHWDRDGGFNATSSCWLRVGTSIAGNKWGTMFIPRVGQEVIVDFLQGDPDQPIIVGSVYNPATMPHYDLPKFKTLSYIKTRTSPDDGKGFNELRFEDKAGKEQVFIHSNKRYDLRAKGSMYETCGGNRQESIGMRSDNKPGGNLAISVGGNFDLHVKQDNYIGIDGKVNNGVTGDVVEAFEANQQTVVTGNVEVNARSITLEALTAVTLKVGASFVKVDLVGVTIEGPLVKINSGGAAQPTGPAVIDSPLDAEGADTGEPGYLDKPRTGGGGGRKRRTLNGQHAPNITHQAFNLTHAAGTADDMDRALVAAELSKLPPYILQRMDDNGTTVQVCRNSVTEVRQDLQGVQPRGWPAGSTWDSVPGLTDPNSNQVIIATTGHNTPAGAHVPVAGEGHGSSNMVIHESMHSIDHHGPNGQDISSTDPNFVNARNNDPNMMADGYEGTANTAGGAEEGYAESAARYYSGDPNDAANHPGPHSYWESDPLNPNPRPAGP